GKVDANNIRKFEGVMSSYPKQIILGIFMTGPNLQGILFDTSTTYQLNETRCLD
ncbi:6098_t:CDS:1, partial [Dentiscutata erythropus]